MTTTRPMPALFIGHGSPMNLIADNDFTRSLKLLSGKLPTPKAVCVISAHWQTRGTRVCGSPKPRQIYDFYGFPDVLYKIKYEPEGFPALAERAIALLGGEREDIVLDNTWGDDHAAWAVLKHLYPAAEVPLFLVSVDMTAPSQRHFMLGARLAAIREEGVLIIGSGNIVHNLYEVDMQNESALPDTRGVRFDESIKSALLARDVDALIHYDRFGEDAQFSVPTRDHYLPLLWTAALQREEDEISFPCELMQNRSVSMRSVLYG